MSARRRLRKPELERTSPIRSWSTILKPPGVAPPPRPAGRPPRKGHKTSKPESPKKKPSAAARGVELGYKVVEDYVRQGRKSAEAFGASALGTTAASEMQKLTERMFQYASDFGTVWLELLSRVTSEGMAARAAAPPAPAASPATAPPAAPAEAPVAPLRPRALAVEVLGGRAAEIELALDETGASPALRAENLRAEGPSGDRLLGLVLDSTAERITVRLQVQRTQPAGLYRGVVVNAVSNVPCGTLTVRLMAKAGTRGG